MEKDAIAMSGKKVDDATRKAIDMQFRVIGFADGNDLTEKMANAAKLRELNALAK